MVNKSTFYKSIEEYTKNNGTKFFEQWFRKYGKSYTFVFKKNLKVTNIQYAELISLIKIHIKLQNTEQSLQFLSVKAFNNTIQQLLSTFLNFKKRGTIPKKIELINKLYAKLIEHIVVVDSFYGSCSVFIPHNMTLDIESICAYSGYIHSCGENIYTRKIQKNTFDSFKEKLINYVKNINITTGQKIPFTLYAHEDFTPFDRDESTEFFKNGLDDIKFYAEKLYFESIPLTEVINSLKKNKELNKKLDFATPGDYHKNIKGKFENSIWIILDKSIQSDSSCPGKDKYFICYNQMYINENPYHIFNENKPGWIDHTTIPHTLMGAMINITRANWPKKDKIKLLDPFIGSGTTFLESLKYKNLIVIGSDLNSLAKLVTKDNLTFFAMDSIELNEIFQQIISLESIFYKEVTSKHNKELEEKIKKQSKEDNSISLNSPKYNVETFYSNWVKEIDIIETGNFNKRFINNLENRTIVDRLIFYNILKTNKRNYQGLKRKSKKWKPAFLKEITKFRKELESYIKLRQREQKSNSTSKSTISKYFSNYSFALSINPSSLKMKKVENITSNREAIAMLKKAKKDKEKFDIIITDPPYGFNTDENVDRFAELYSQMIDLMIEILNDRGQLIICLPERSMTGKNIYFFTQKEIIIHQVLIKAKAQNKKAILPFNILPQPTFLFKAPYFWESEKALRRAILHFQISK